MILHTFDSGIKIKSSSLAAFYKYPYKVIQFTDCYCIAGNLTTNTVIVEPGYGYGGASKGAAFLNALTMERSIALIPVGFIQERLRRRPWLSTVTCISLSFIPFNDSGFFQY